MSLFGCKHTWTEAARTYNPSRVAGSIQVWGKADTGRLIHGFTVIELRCSKCGDVRHRKTNGKSVAA
jgi:hypothetical protein